jgi:recombination protein RecT
MATKRTNAAPPARAQEPQGPPDIEHRARALFAYLLKAHDRVQKALPQNSPLTGETMIRFAAICCQKNSKLLQCTQISILQAVMEAAQLGLELGGPLAEAHLVPFGAECKLIPDYKGILRLARRSEEFNVIEAVLVNSRDVFRVIRNPFPTVLHEPSYDDHPGLLKWAYAYAQLTNGTLVLEVMSKLELDVVRSKARSQEAWKEWYGEMAKKTVLKRLLKRQARSTEVLRAMVMDNRDYVLPGSGEPTGRPDKGAGGLRKALTTPAGGSRHPSEEELAQDWQQPQDEQEAAQARSLAAIEGEGADYPDPDPGPAQEAQEDIVNEPGSEG